MSLSVALEGKTTEKNCMCPTCLTEHTHEEAEELFWANITHNLGAMAKQAGIYKPLWRPEEIGIEKAGHLIKPLKKGLSLLKQNPEKFMEFNPSNGWGDYDGLIKFVESYLAACVEHPSATIYISR